MGLQAGGWNQGWIASPHKMCGQWPAPYVGMREFYCGPASQTTIGLWRREVHGDAFPVSDLYTFDGFNYHTPVFLGMTFPTGWRNGFRDYAASLNPPEHFTFEIREPGTYWQIVNDVDLGWPLGLMGRMKGPGNGLMKYHWVAVKEYGWIGGQTYRVVVADTWFAVACPPSAHRRCLCWVALTARTVWVIPVRD